MRGFLLALALGGVSLVIACSAEESCRRLVDTRWLVPVVEGGVPVAVAADSNGDVFVVMTTPEQMPPYQTIIAKHAGADGAVLWSRTYDFFVMRGMRVAVDAAGALFVAGMKITADGEVDWVLEQTAAIELFVLASVVGEGGDVFMAGRYFNPGDSDTVPSENGMMVARVSGESGESVWMRSFGSELGDGGAATDIAVDPDGDVLVVGHAGTRVDFDDTALDGNGPLALRLAGEDGAVTWAVRPADWEGLESLGTVPRPSGPRMAIGDGGEAIVVAGTTPDADSRTTVLSSLSPSGEVTHVRELLTTFVVLGGVTVDPTTADVILSGTAFGPADLDGDGRSCEPPSYSTACSDVAATRRLPAGGGCTEFLDRGILARYVGDASTPVDTWFDVDFSDAVDTAPSADGFAVAIQTEGAGPEPGGMLALTVDDRTR